MVHIFQLIKWSQTIWLAVVSGGSGDTSVLTVADRHSLDDSDKQSDEQGQKSI